MAEVNFEKSITELENIVKALESGNLSLDEMIKLFEQGMKLSASCNKLLDEAESKINILFFFTHYFNSSILYISTMLIIFVLPIILVTAAFGIIWSPLAKSSLCILNSWLDI